MLAPGQKLIPQHPFPPGHPLDPGSCSLRIAAGSLTPARSGSLLAQDTCSLRTQVCSWAPALSGHAISLNTCSLRTTFHVGQPFAPGHRVAPGHPLNPDPRWLPDTCSLRVQVCSGPRCLWTQDLSGCTLSPDTCLLWTIFHLGHPVAPGHSLAPETCSPRTLLLRAPLPLDTGSL